MNEDTSRKQCKICHGYLFEDDDTVVCPVCGAPHHRDCWNTVGHCGLEELHGTEDQYDRKKEEEAAGQSADDGQKTRSCPYCGRISHSADAPFCPYCGQAYDGARQNPASGFGPGVFSFDVYGGIPSDTVIENGVTVKEAAQFVGSNSPRYMHKFVSLNKQSKHSWNWAAFFFPAVWNFSRKMYANGILYLILSVASELCLIPFNAAVADRLGNSFSSYDVAELITGNPSVIGVIPLVLLGLGFVLSLVPMIICGINADWSYRNFAVKKTAEIKADDEVDDVEEELRAAGNISLLWLVLSLLAVNFLPRIIALLLL